MNTLELALENSLSKTLKAKIDGVGYNANIMVTGNPISDNQKFIEKWAEKNNIGIIRADNEILSDGKLYKESHGILRRSEEKLSSLMPLLSERLSQPWIKADKNYIVLFHMYNWQTNTAYRESLLPFVVERKIIPGGKFDGVYVEVPNILFCVASILQQNYGENFEITENEDKAYPVKVDHSHYNIWPFRLFNDDKTATLSDEEKGELIKLTEEKYVNPMHKAAAFILLNDRQSLDKFMEKLSEDDREHITNMPFFKSYYGG